MKPHRRARGMSRGSKKGNMTHAKIIPIKTKLARTMSPNPAKTNSRKVAAQKSAINARITPLASRVPTKGPATCRPSMTMLTVLRSISSAHAAKASMITARAMAVFFATGSRLA